MRDTMIDRTENHCPKDDVEIGRMIPMTSLAKQYTPIIQKVLVVKIKNYLTQLVITKEEQGHAMKKIELC